MSIKIVVLWYHEIVREKPGRKTLRAIFVPYAKGKSNRKGFERMSSFKYKEQYAVIVICEDAAEQENIYNRLKAEGFKLKVVAV